MEITKAQVEQILNTLPIGYYIYRDVTTSLSDENCSYYDVVNDKIYISFPQLQKTMANLDDDNVEDNLRCLLYHETSHAILTPKTLRVDNVINVFEDERIETILKSHYHRVNFKDFVKKLNAYDGSEPTSAWEMFYHVVRFREGPQQFVDRVARIIDRHKTLSMHSTSTYEYRNDIYTLYNDIEQYFKENNKTQESQQNQDYCQDGMQDKTQSIKETNTQNLSQTTISKMDDTRNKQTDEETEEAFVKELIENIVNEYDNANIDAELSKLLTSVKNSTKNNSSAINAYSGVFNPRSVIRNDYKYFVQQNRAGHIKAFSKVHLNLFIDCSGSFSHNDKVTNMLLKSLVRFEKSNPNFAFDLIACGEGERLLLKNKRIQYSEGGTYLSEKMAEIYKSQQFGDAQNMNIVLYDGDAFSSRYWHTDLPKDVLAKRFKTFNNDKTVVISDDENEAYIKKYCKHSNYIITKDYTTELISNVLKSLQRLCK